MRSAGVGDRRTLIDIDRSHREREGCASLSFVPSFPLKPGCQAKYLSGRFRSLLWLPYTCFHSIIQLLPLFLLLLLLLLLLLPLLLLYCQGTFHVGSGPVESGKSAMGING